jgi:hypothetical protein
MRRTAVLLTVLVLASLLSANQASAYGWLGLWRGARYQTCQFCSAATKPHHVRVCAKTAEPAATAISKAAIESDLAATVDESADLTELIDVMKGILMLENERLDQALRWHEEAEELEYGED